MAKFSNNDTTILMMVAFTVSLFLTFSVSESRSNLISAFKANAEADVATCDSFVGWRNGDTCTTLAATLKLTEESFLAVNPNINCNNVFVGQWICADGGAGARKDPKALATCKSVVAVKNAETCTSIANAFNLTFESFVAINPNFNCERIFVGQWVCVDGTAN